MGQRQQHAHYRAGILEVFHGENVDVRRAAIASEAGGSGRGARFDLRASGKNVSIMDRAQNAQERLGRAPAPKQRYPMTKRGEAVQPTKCNRMLMFTLLVI